MMLYDSLTRKVTSLNGHIGARARGAAGAEAGAGENLHAIMPTGGVAVSGYVPISPVVRCA